MNDLEQMRFSTPGTGDGPAPVFLWRKHETQHHEAEHWSYSSVSQFLKCPLQFYFERVLKLPRKSKTDALVLGSSLHSALAVYHRKLQVGEPVTTQEIHTAYLDAWEDQAKDGQIVAFGEKSLSDSRDLGISLVDVYLKEPPSGTIIALESPLLAPIANSRGDFLEKPLLIVA